MSASAIRASHEEYLRRAGGTWFDFEQLLCVIYNEVVRPNDWCVDVGANHGSHTFQMARRVAPRGRVLAIEIVPGLADKLQEQLDRVYPHMRPNVTIIKCGVFDAPGEADFFFMPDQDGLSSLRDRPHVPGEKTKIRVKLEKLDDIVPEFEDRSGRLATLFGRRGRGITFLKIDVEGAELPALRGARTLLQRHMPTITFECDRVSAGAFAYRPSELQEFLTAFGYKVFDYFGNEFASEDDFAASLVWDYVAFPDSFKREARVFSRVRAKIDKVVDGRAVSAWRRLATAALGR